MWHADAPSLPVTLGLIGAYAASSFNTTSGIWPDSSGAGNHATLVGGIASLVQAGRGDSDFANWHTIIKGSPSTIIQFPAAILPVTYTLCHVARFTGPTYSAIFSSASVFNWFSGFHLGRTRQSMYLGDLNSNNIGVSQTAWQLTCEQPMMMRASGVQWWRNIGFSAGQRAIPMGINVQPGTGSDFAVAAVVIYDRLLSLDEVLRLEDFLSLTYGVPLLRPRLLPPVMRNLMAWYTAGGVTPTPFDTWCPAVTTFTTAGGCASASGLSVVQGNNSGSEPLVSGSRASRVIFPAHVLPPVYTLFHLARYSGSSRARILASGNGVWFHSGFHGGRAGNAHRPTTSFVSDYINLHDTNWVLSTDQMYTYRSNGIDRTTINRGPNMTSGIHLLINGMTIPDETSEFEVYAVLVYNDELTMSEVMAMEEYLSGLYQVPLQRPPPPPVSLGMLAWYTAGSYEAVSNKWRDISGRRHHVTVASAASTLSIVQPTASNTTSFIRGQPYLRGTTLSQLAFPSPILPPNYTLFHVSKCVKWHTEISYLMPNMFVSWSICLCLIMKQALSV